MFFTEVDGKVLPAAIAGHPALELCNTWVGWNSPPGTGGDYLRDYDTLAIWARERAGLTEAEARAACGAAAAAPEAGSRALRETRRLRSQLYLTLTDPDSVTGTADIARLAHEAMASRRLERNEDGSFSWRFANESPARLPLLAAAKAASELLTSPERTSVHACPGHDCGWLFVDPRGRRKWCIMAVCGNRAKARAHAERTAAAARAASI